MTCSGSHGIAGLPHTGPCSQILSSWPCSWILPWVPALLEWPAMISILQIFSWPLFLVLDISKHRCHGFILLHPGLCPWEKMPLQPSVTATVLRLRGQKTTPQGRHVACHKIDIDLSQGSPQELSFRLGVCGPVALLRSCLP